MKKILFILLFVLNLTSCTNDDVILSSKITAEIIQTKQLNLSNYYNFEWNQLIIIGPYSKISKIENEQKINLHNVGNSIEDNDNINLLVFLKDKKAVKSVELNRMYGDFKNNYNRLIPKSKANFNLEGDIYPKNPAVLKLK